MNSLIRRLTRTKYFSARAVSDIAALGLCGVVVALAALPTGGLFYALRPLLASSTAWPTATAWAIFFGVGYILFAVSLLVVSVALRQLPFMKSNEKPFEVNSLETMRFALFHGLLNLAQIFALRLIRGTSMMNAYYRGMGATVGRRTIINTMLISDCDLVSIGDDCLIGGDVAINGHSADRGKVIRGRVTIGNRVTVGQYATVLAGARIDDDVIVAANSLVPKFRHLKAGQAYAGVPARYSGVGGIAPIGGSGPSSKALRPADPAATAVGGFILKEELQIQPLLLESYKLRHAEVLDIIRFMSQVTATSLGLLVTVLLYSVTNSKPQLLLFLPPLAGLAYAILLGSTIAMQRLGMKACEIEIMFSHARVSGFDWEMKYGSLGSARVSDLDAILVQFILLGVLVVGTVITWRRDILMSADSFLGYQVQSILLGIDLAIAGWIVLNVVYLVVRRRLMRSGLRRFAEHASLAPNQSLGTSSGG
jgi:acetyltransferase-like isoleucine patch superfamily enzyme